MSKRTIAEESAGDYSLRNGDRPMSNAQEGDAEHFEDDFEDEFIEEEFVDDEDDAQPSSPEPGAEGAEKMDLDNQTFIPGRHTLAPGEVLEPDESAYEMLHRLEPPWPCLSFDIVHDNLGDGRARKKYPATVYAVSGTQAAQGHDSENELLVMKMSRLSRMERFDDENSDDDDDDSDDENSDPILETKSIKLGTCTNRIRQHQTPSSDPTSIPSTLTATMTESGSVLIHDITPHLNSFNTPGASITPQQNKPIHTIKAHKSVEGYAVNWAPKGPTRRLLTGDNNGKIFATEQHPSGSWITEDQPFKGHRGSVEELHWTPNEKEAVFASAGSDGTVRIWDLRSNKRKPKITMQVSNSDVNVLSWSHHQGMDHLLASGADDGQWAVWDLRQWKDAAGKPLPMAEFNFHKDQITSVEWHPTDNSVVAVAAGDNTLTLWDISVEFDDEESRYTADAQDVPAQLLFVHYMEQVKECHWHPQIPGCVMATGGGGFGVFKTISV